MTTTDFLEINDGIPPANLLRAKTIGMHCSVLSTASQIPLYCLQPSWIATLHCVYFFSLCFTVGFVWSSSLSLKGSQARPHDGSSAHSAPIQQTSCELGHSYAFMWCVDGGHSKQSPCKGDGILWGGLQTLFQHGTNPSSPTGRGNISTHILSNLSLRWGSLTPYPGGPSVYYYS